MQSLLFSINNYFERLPLQVIRLRWWVVLGSLAFAAFIAVGIGTRFTMNLSPEIWFEDESPTLLNRDEFRAQFGSDEGVFIVYRPDSGDVFSESALRTLESLHRELEETSRLQSPDGELANPLSRIDKVDSLYNARYQIAQQDTLISKKLIGADFPDSKEEREARRDIAKSQYSFQRLFFSDDFRYGALQIKTDFGAIPVESSTDMDLLATDDLLLEDDFEVSGFDGGIEESVGTDERPEFVSESMAQYEGFILALKAILNKPEYREFDFHLSGNPVNASAQLQSTADAGAFLGVMVCIILILLWWLFKSFSAVVWPLLCIVFSLTCSIGTGCWLGFSYSTMLVLTTMLAITVGIASCVHVISAYVLFCKDGKDHISALSLAYKKTGLAIMLTSVTTMVGMLSLTLADMPAIQSFGFVSALTVLYSFFFVAFFLPLLLNVWHPSPKREAGGALKTGRTSGFHLQAILRYISGFTARHSRKIVAVYVALLLVLLFGATQVKVNSNFTEVFVDDHPIPTATRLVDKELMGALNLEIYLDFKESDAFKDPVVLSRIDEFQRYVMATYPDKVIKTLSIADIVRDTNKVMNEGRGEFDVIPDDPRLAAQLLYLFNTANPVDRRTLVSDDYSRSHITLMMVNGGSHEYTEFFKDIQQDLQRFFDPLKGQYPNAELKVTGVFHLMMELIEHISWTQLKSFGFALLIITAIMMISLGSRQAGLISILPNVLPALFTFGVMGLLGIPLNIDMLIIAPIIIGIAVDDTIHFITHYRNAWFEYGDVEKAMQSTLSEVGQAVVLTTLILGFGFGVLGFSDYLGLAKPGVAGAIAITVALLSDLLFLPALIRWIKPDLGRRRFLEKQGLKVPVTPG